METKGLLEEFFNFLRKDLIEFKKNGIYNIELPFPKPSGDSIILKITKEGSNYLISDDGFIDNFLFNHTIDLWELNKTKMKDIFEKLKKRYDIISDKAPEIVIVSDAEKIYRRIYEITIILNELSSLVLLNKPVRYDIFKNHVQIYFKEEKLKYELNPEIKIPLKKEIYPVTLDFKFNSENVYVKIITSDRIIRDWCTNFDLIKKTVKKKINLWALYNDEDSVSKSKVEDFFGEYADEVIAWTKEKNRFLQFK